MAKIRSAPVPLAVGHFTREQMLRPLHIDLAICFSALDLVLVLGVDLLSQSDVLLRHRLEPEALGLVALAAAGRPVTLELPDADSALLGRHAHVASADIGADTLWHVAVVIQIDCGVVGATPLAELDLAVIFVHVDVTVPILLTATTLALLLLGRLIDVLEAFIVVTVADVLTFERLLGLRVHRALKLA